MSTKAAQLEIVHYPAPVLRKKAKPVTAITDEVRAVAQRMLELMHAEPGVGLAATQVGLSWRLFVACTTGDPKDDRVYINPVLSDPGKELEDSEEGCLSLPDIRGQIRRPKRITLTAQDLDGNSVTLTADDLAARVWQHEIDHLDGVLIIDRMPPMDRLANQKQIRDLEKAAHSK